jgi:hypothetical protein
MSLSTIEKEWKQKWCQYVLDHLDKPWNYSWLSINSNLLWDVVQANPQLPWNYAWMGSNPNIKSS